MFKKHAFKLTEKHLFIKFKQNELWQNYQLNVMFWVIRRLSKKAPTLDNPNVFHLNFETCMSVSLAFFKEKSMIWVV